MKFCRFCGRQCQDDSNFCEACGRPFGNPNTSQTQQTYSNNSMYEQQMQNNYNSTNNSYQNQQTQPFSQQGSFTHPQQTPPQNNQGYQSSVSLPPFMTGKPYKIDSQERDERTPLFTSDDAEYDEFDSNNEKIDVSTIKSKSDKTSKLILVLVISLVLVVGLALIAMIAALRK